jgi:hypothetical protein
MTHYVDYADYVGKKSKKKFYVGDAKRNESEHVRNGTCIATLFSDE